MWSDFAFSESAELGEKLAAEKEREEKVYKCFFGESWKKELEKGCWYVAGEEERCLASQGWKWPKGHLSPAAAVYFEKSSLDTASAKI